eukprot:Phypoly_transcript_00629.p1 GENE.Phypoly_transcript_00629~~Phypoly_transcript_00629.p1  ORF type:complete len:390 (+),score=75.65 Phypoly_transcript_00629:82-1251(+)
MSQQVSLVIKNPAKSGDFKCNINLLETRVIDLKNKIESEYDNHPAPDHQKIIFAGKLLQDNSLLADVLQQHDITLPQTFHLIVRPQTDPDSNQPTPSSSQSTQPHSTQVPQVPPASGPFYQYGAQGAPGGMLGYGYGGYATYGGQAGFMGYGYPGNNQHYPYAHTPNSTQPTTNNNQFNNNNNNNQLFPMHMNPQFRQFLQYQQQQHQLHPYHPQVHSLQGQALHLQEQQQQQQQQQRQQQQQQQQQQPLPQQPLLAEEGGANRNNAAAGGNNNLSLLFKLAFLVLILSQGGDDSRIIVLCLAALLVYLYQTGHIRLLNRVNLFPQVQPQDLNPQAQGGFFRELTLILTSFVYSLFPTWQPPTPNPVPPIAPAPPGPQAVANAPPPAPQ